ncbi:hypothetical protein GL264_17435 [Aeromonas jandaei]|uniref:hypothetical protein n=1 Tax=Aeromonas jandaei TaxID=650 RepID=UPI001C5B18CD|nr:hypothetical protein [Aeromonas jandaei]MBW3762574.1 hypothetical protein [Aeromonas jandaei]
MNHSPFSRIIDNGHLILRLLNRGELDLADIELDKYLGSLDDIFFEIKSETNLDIEKRQILEQFKEIFTLIEEQKSSVEIELLQFAKAGRATKRYKSNAG